MQARARFRNPGGSLIVLGTALLLAGLVIVALLLMSATLEKALSSRGQNSQAPHAPANHPAQAPALQVYATSGDTATVNPASPTP